MKNRIFLIYAMAALMLGIASCTDDEKGQNATPPSKVTGVTWTPLPGGARFHYTMPLEPGLLEVEAEYEQGGKTLKFTSSYYKDSLDVHGFDAATPHEVRLYVVNTAGQRSQPESVTVTPLVPAHSRVAEDIVVKPAFSSFLLKWENTLAEPVNVYVDFSYTLNGRQFAYTSVFASVDSTDRRFVENLPCTSNDPIDVKIRVEDRFGNMTASRDMGQIRLFDDEKIPKSGWTLPNANDTIAGEPMCFGNAREGMTVYTIDDIVQQGELLDMNYMHTYGRGRTGNVADGNMPWNLIIDLGDWYELSRVVIHQRHSSGAGVAGTRNQYFQSENVGRFRFYIQDDREERPQKWSSMLGEYLAIDPKFKTELEYYKRGQAGDLYVIFPNEPNFTKPTRWFRYEAVNGFGGNYTSTDGNSISEITLYGRKATNK